MAAGLESPRDRPVPLVIGVTGNIACGKSTVMEMLRELGASTIDADRVYHQLITPDSPLWRALVERFGPTILNEDRTIDRRELGRIVFSDREALADLDRITHPAVIDAVRSIIANSEQRVIAVDAVKLVESRMHELCDAVWLIVCDPDQQLQRLRQRAGVTEEEAIQRIQAQPPIGPKRQVADAVIDNSGSLDATRAQVRSAWNELMDNDRVVTRV